MVYRGPVKFGIVGLTGIHSNGTKAIVDSYNALAGPYGGSNVHHNANIASNRDIDLGNADVYGDVRPGMPDGTHPNGYSVIQGPTSLVSGWISPLDHLLVFPPSVVPSPAPCVLPSTTSVAGGTYQTTTFPPKNAITFTGPATVYVTGTIDVKNNTPITTYQNLPANLQIFVVGAGDVTCNGGGQIYAHIYAPQSNMVLKGAATSCTERSSQTISISAAPPTSTMTRASATPTTAITASCW